MRHPKGVSKAYLHEVVDTYSNSAFECRHVHKQPEAAVVVLRNEAMLFNSEKGLEVQGILTANGKMFCGGEVHPYRLYLKLNEPSTSTARPLPIAGSWSGSSGGFWMGSSESVCHKIGPVG